MNSRKGPSRNDLAEATGKMTPARQLKLLEERYGFRLKKSLSQRFLVDPLVLDRIVRAVAPERGDTVLEVGAGAGFLTERLAERGCRVLAVEVDDGLVEVLRETLGRFKNIEIIHEDILRLDIAKTLEKMGIMKCLVAGNLPYHISTPAIFHLLEAREVVARMVIMVQREVGIRMAAGPGGKEYGALSVGIAGAGKCRKLFEVGPGAFIPRPQVRSIVMGIVPDRERMEPELQRKVTNLVKAVFGQRRKMLVNAIEAMAGGKSEAQRILAATGIQPGRRGETLAYEEFVGIASKMA